MNGDYLRIPRDEFERFVQWFPQDRFSEWSAQVDLIHLSARMDEDVTLDSDICLVLERTSLRRNRRRLAGRWRWTVAKVDRFLEQLRELGRIRMTEGGRTLNVPLYWPQREPENARRGNSIAPSVRREVLAAGGGVCARCGTDEDLTIDHIMPVALGGGRERSNLRVLCRSCNSRKGAKHPNVVGW